ncbi:MAG: DUF4294 domain-containing protein [Bacteroidales bacterium]
MARDFKIHALLRYISALFVVVLVCANTDRAYCQQADTSQQKLYFSCIVEDGDTIPMFYLRGVYVFPPSFYTRKMRDKKYWRTVMRVKKVLPYAKDAARILQEVSLKYEDLDKSSDKRKYLKEAEKAAMKEYSGKIKKLSKSEGRILLKLIDRETHRTSYAIIKDMKSGRTAFIWQSVARLFGQDLKSVYDPNGEDKELEEIVDLVEKGVF